MKTNSISAGLAVHARTITTTRLLIFRRASLWTGFLVFATIALGPQPAEAAVTEAWVHRYSNEVGGANCRAVKVVRDAAGDIIVTGTMGRRILTNRLLLRHSTEPKKTPVREINSTNG